MQVDPTSEFAVALDDRRYVFCSLECRDAFVSHPEDYAAR
jgi:YHS domain-containing protein